MSSLPNSEKIVLDVISIDGKLQAILPEAKIHSGGTTDKKVRKETKMPLPREEVMGYSHAPWGKNDRLPNEVRCKIEAVPMAGAAIKKLVAMMYGNGLVYYKTDDLRHGTKVNRAFDPKVEKFIRQNRLGVRWLLPQFADYKFNVNTFSEMILSGDGSKIVGIYHKTAEHCRLDKMNERTFSIENLIYSPDFSLHPNPQKERKKAIPLIPWHFHEQERFFKKLGARRKFAWHSLFRTPGTTYYARQWWIGLIKKNGWMDVSANIPKIVSAMQNNQISLKYQILIPEQYFIFRHPEWENYTAVQRNKLIDQKISEINEALTGVDNSYKSISTIFKEDPVTKLPMGKIEILAIDDKAKKGVWVPDSNAADSQIVQGLGLHPSQMGLSPEGGKMGAGSGSDQRESFNTGISLNTIDQEVILEPLNFISEYNGWGVTFMIDHTTHTTTNDQESGLKPSDNTITVD